jgi:hypothetical protein
VTADRRPGGIRRSVSPRILVDGSTPTAVAPRWAASLRKRPGPQPTSTTRSPARTPARSATSRVLGPRPNDIDQPASSPNRPSNSLSRGPATPSFPSRAVSPFACRPDVIPATVAPFHRLTVGQFYTD